MKKLCYLIKITFQTKFAYIKAFWFNIFGTAVSILIYYFLWKYVFQSRDELHGFTAAQITTYVILSRLLSSQFSGGINREFAEWRYRRRASEAGATCIYTFWKKSWGIPFLFPFQRNSGYYSRKPDIGRHRSGQRGEFNSVFHQCTDFHWTDVLD